LKHEFQITYRRSSDNLHVRLSGDFTDVCAWRLLKLLRKHGGSKKVFVDTHDVGQVTQEGAKLFKTHMTPHLLPPEGLYFKGENGFKIGPNGSRVLIYRKETPSRNLSKQWSTCRFTCLP